MDDKARLDWIMAQWCDGIHIELCAAGGPTWRDVAPIATVYCANGGKYSSIDLRMAIDSAMKSSAINTR